MITQQNSPIFLPQYWEDDKFDSTIIIEHFGAPIISILGETMIIIKQGRKHPLDTPERREREGERDKER